MLDESINNHDKSGATSARSTQDFFFSKKKQEEQKESENAHVKARLSGGRKS